MTEHDTTMTEHDTTMTEHDTTTPPPCAAPVGPHASRVYVVPMAHYAPIAQKYFREENA